MTHAVPAWHEQHRSWSDASHEERVVIGAADHLHAGHFRRHARLPQYTHDPGGTGRRRIRVQQLGQVRDTSSRADLTGAALDFLKHAVAPAAVDIADIDLEPHLARDAVDRAWKYLAHAHRSDRVARPGRQCRALHQ